MATGALVPLSFRPCRCVTGSLAFARRVAHRFCLMDKGRVMSAGPIGELSEEMVGLYLSV